VAAPEEHLATALPSQWTGNAEAGSIAIDADWWQQFDSPELNQLVPRVLEANPDLRVAGASLRQAEALARVAGAARWPSAAIGLNAGRSQQNLIGFPIPGAGDVISITSNNFGLALNLGWEIDLWGRIDAAVEAAESDFLASQANWEAARLSLAGQTVRLFLARAEVAEQLRIAQAQAQLAAQRLQHLQTRYQAGSATAAQVLAAEQVVTAWKSQLAQLELSLDGQERARQTLLGEYPHGLAATQDGPAPSSASASVLPSLPDAIPAGVPAELLSRRPDLAAAEARYYAAAAREREARASLYPRLSLTSSAGTSSNAIGDLLDGDFRVWSLAGGLTAPLFEGGRLRGNLAAREAGREQAAWAFVRDVLAALSEVETALRSETVLRSLSDDLILNEQRATRQSELSLRRYERGSGSLLTLLDTRSAALDARSARISAELALLQNRVDLYLALGGGFRLHSDS
jgi:NodT family efflux transporter outer membrane factor (OMF) lipoprotein